MNRILQAAIVLMAILVSHSVLPSAYAQSGKIYIDVGEAQVKKSLMALPPFLYYGSQGSSKKNIEAGQELFKTVHNDLNISSYFNFIKPEAFLEDTSKTGLKPAPGEANGFQFQNWKTIGTDFLIRGGYRVNGDKLSFEVYTYYVPQAKLVFGKTYEGTIGSARKIAHTFANDVIENLTKKKGMFLTKVVVSSDRPPSGESYQSGKKEIWVMDWDGANANKITNHDSIAISPAWSPDGEQVAYTAFAYHKKAKTRNADLFLYNLTSGKRWLISYRKGINSGAAFHPDGKHILLTLSQGGTPDIFQMTTDGKSLRRLTRGPGGAMNVEPAVSPDGTKVAFSSDRSGKPMVYIMDLKTQKATRKTFAGKYNATPSWSPDGKKIAFAGYDKGHFDIFVMNADGTDLKRLTDAKRKNGTAASNEDPTFSPDGRHVMFVSDRDGNKQLYLVNVDGTDERRLTFDRYNYFKPKWSPLLDK